MPSDRPQPRPRRTQRQRSQSTRLAILDATIECLIERGYARTTTVEVAAQAGVSRGAQLHHFPSKADLVTCAVAHLAERRGAELRREAARRRIAEVSTADRAAAAIDLLWSVYSDRLMVAAIELWVAARTDPALLQRLRPLEQQFGRALRSLCEELFGLEISRGPRFGEAINLTLHMMRGMALWGVTGIDSTRSARSVAAWKELIQALLRERSD